MSNANTPGTVPGEYTRGTGFTFPAQPTFAQDTSASTNSATTTSGASVAPTFPGGPSIGQLAFNTTLNGLYCWTGSAWVHA